MSISTLRRQVKNVAYNFSDAQVKVREATSNDPWGPTTALMSEIADLTHSSMPFTEIMSMLWKRLNDHGKNWRHVYKSLVLLDYLIKCGSEKVAQQCRENIYSIETLKDFQHIEDNRDQGLNVREKAKHMVALLNDEERLKNERARFLLTRKRFIQSGLALSSDGAVRSVRRPLETSVIDSEFEEARPSSLGEEEMQLQIAIALSREECEKEEELRKSDAMRLQIALEESKREKNYQPKIVSGASLSQSAVDDLLSLGLGELTTSGAPTTSSTHAYNSTIIDPWSPQPSINLTTNNNVNQSLNNNLTSVLQAPIAPANNDPWSVTITSSTTKSLDSLSKTTTPSTVQNDPWAVFDNLKNLDSTNNKDVCEKNINFNDQTQNSQQGQIRSNVKTPESFLGKNSLLVNLDNLMGPKNIQNKSASNPFMLGSLNMTSTTNPFAAQQRPSPSLHEMIQAQRVRSTPHSIQSQNQNFNLNQQQTSPTNPFALH